VIIVSGGNTLYARDLWEKCGLGALLVLAADRGVVLAGGSAGAICWFDGGHSDSGDPDTFKQAMLQTELVIGQDESSSLGDNSPPKQWDYMRVPCLGIFPGLVCPHADSVQSNGVLRMTDFDKMMLRHSGERGICIDHFAALIVDQNYYHVLSLPGRPGSVMPDRSWSIAREGVPGVWQKDVVNGNLHTLPVASTGPLAALFKVADEITPDPRLEQCRLNNPLD
jgi:dipeptidase E